MEDNLIGELNEVVRESLFDVAEEILESKQVKIFVERGSKEGDNFMGICYRITCCTEDESRETHLFLKTASSNETKRTLLQTRECFLREIYVFEVALPYFREFQESRGVYLGGFTEYPNFFKSIKTEPLESLFIQDLAQQNFVMIDKNALTVDHVFLVMKTLGKLHAVSLAFKDQEPEKFSEIVNEITEIMFDRKSTMFSTFVNQMENIAINCITDDEDAHLLKALLELYETHQFDQIIELVDGNESEPYSVMLHGDMWSNNTMFDYDENDNTLRNISLIDWQMARYGSPVLDIMYYIFNGTTRKLRGCNYNMYLQTYYESLSDVVLKLGSDPEKVFPNDAFQEQLKKYGKFGLLNAAFALPISQQEVDLDDFTVLELSDGFKKRFRDLVSDSYILGYI